MGVMVILMEGEGRTGGRVMPELKTLTAAEVETTRQELGGGCRRRRLLLPRPAHFQGYERKLLPSVGLPACTKQPSGLHPVAC